MYCNGHAQATVTTNGVDQSLLFAFMYDDDDDDGSGSYEHDDNNNNSEIVTNFPRNYVLSLCDTSERVFPFEIHTYIYI